MSRAVLAIDQGTSSSKAVLVDESGAVVSLASAPVTSSFPRPGWVEQSPDEIWRSVLRAIESCLAKAPDVTPTALAISNQRESALVWSRIDGRPTGPMIGWQDSRTASECDRLRSEGAEPFVRSRTGLALDPMFSATKLRWLLDRAPGGMTAAEQGELCAGTVDAWLVYKLTGGEVFACEAGNASRTQLMNLRVPAWDANLLELFGVPVGALPPILRSDAGFGRTVAEGALPADLPIAAVLADSHAALFGHGSFEAGSGKATYGTGTSVMTVTGEPVESAGGVAQTLAWLTDKPTWAFEGNIIASGAALDWMAETLGVGSGADLEALARSVDTTDGVHLVPAFAGLGAPYWDRAATGVITGVTRGTRREHLARAALEAVAMQVCDVLEATEQASGHELDVLHADGGATAGGLLMQTQADLLGRPVLASTTAEMSALGAAHLAGTVVGLWEGEEELAALPRPVREFRPVLLETERRRRRQAWSEAVERSRGHAVRHHQLEESIR